MYRGLMQYLEQCPQLKGQRFNFDFIGGEPIQWSLQIPTNDPRLSGTVTGDTHKKQDFILVSMSFFGDDVDVNIGNLDGFQAISKWFRKNNRNKVYPDMGAGKIVTGVYAQTDGYIEGTTESAARYQIQCRVEYVEKSETDVQLPKAITGKSSEGNRPKRSETLLPRFIRED